MMFILLFEDNEEYADMRRQYMTEHLKFLTRNKKNIHSAGPLRDSESGMPSGGIWIVEAEDKDRVQALVEQDPFWPTGLRKSVKILEWTRVFNDGRCLI